MQRSRKIQSMMRKINFYIVSVSTEHKMAQMITLRDKYPKTVTIMMSKKVEERLNMLRSERLIADQELKRKKKTSKPEDIVLETTQN